MVIKRSAITECNIHPVAWVLLSDTLQLATELPVQIKAGFCCI